MNNFKPNQKIRMNIETIISSKEEQKKMYKISKKYFQNQQEDNWIEVVVYNLLRNRPVFNGIKKLKSDSFFYYDFNYILSALNKEEYERYYQPVRVLLEFKRKGISNNSVSELTQELIRLIENNIEEE